MTIKSLTSHVSSARGQGKVWQRQRGVPTATTGHHSVASSAFEFQEAGDTVHPESRRAVVWDALMCQKHSPGPGPSITPAVWCRLPRAQLTTSVDYQLCSVYKKMHLCEHRGQRLRLLLTFGVSLKVPGKAPQFIPGSEGCRLASAFGPAFASLGLQTQYSHLCLHCHMVSPDVAVAVQMPLLSVCRSLDEGCFALV